MASLIFSVFVLAAGVLFSSSPWHGVAPVEARQQRFLATPTNLTTRLGARIVLPCRVRNPSLQVQWTKGGFGLGLERDLADWRRYRMIGKDMERE